MRRTREVVLAQLFHDSWHLAQDVDRSSATRS